MFLKDRFWPAYTYLLALAQDAGACSGDDKVIAFIEDPAVIEKILTHLNEKATSAGIRWKWMFKQRTIQARVAELDRIWW